MISIMPLASGSRGNAYYIDDGVSPLLLEAGIRFKEIQQKLNFQVSGLAGCLISHGHKDHCKAAADMLRAGVRVCCSAETMVEAGISGHNVGILEPLQVLKVGTWAALPFPLVHDVPNMGILLSHKNGAKLAYITDTAYCKYRFTGLTHVLIECNYSKELLKASDLEAIVKQRIIRNHMSLDRVMEFLKANDLSRLEEIWLLHLSEGNSDAALFKKEVQRLTGKPVYLLNE